MNKLIEIRNQEMMCRERALLDATRREFWLEKAEDWEKRAVDEIASHFRDCNSASLAGAVAETTSSQSSDV
jgi:hypothetical protein